MKGQIAMDTSTHEIRLAGWKTIVEQCTARPEGQTIKQWLALNGINEKQYFYWQRKVRQSVATQLDLPAVRQEAEVTLAQIRVESEPDPKTAFLPAAVIHTDRATIEISAFAPAALTKQIMKVLSNAV